MKIRNHDQLTAAEIHAARAIERRLRGPEPPRVPQCITCDATDGLLPVIVVHSDDSREAGRGVCQACVADKWAIPDFEGNNHCRVEVSRPAEVEVIVNMTPHPVNIIDGDGTEIARFESAGQIRLAATTVQAEPIAGIPTSRTVFGAAEGLPEAIEGTWFIVSQIIKSALPDRTDLLVPAEVVRDSDGQIVGCRSLGK